MPAESSFVVTAVAPHATGAWSLPRRAGASAGTAAASGAGVPARPRRWLGAPAPGALALPPALPTSTQLYAPRAVWVDERRVVVADTGNHRVLIWHDPDPESHSPADVVIGQADFTSEGPQAGGRGPERGLHLPTGVLVHEGRLVVADAWNHRVLIWDAVPQRCDVAADVVIGQPDRRSVEANRAGACGPLGLWWPFGVAMVEGRFYVADTGNRRVLGWDGLPGPGEAPALVLGQPGAHEREENRGRLGPDSFRWPHDLAGAAGRLFVADPGNHRLLGWSPAPAEDAPADIVLGQAGFTSAQESPYRPQTRGSLRFPYGVAIDGGRMAVADSANSRVLLWDLAPSVSGAPADAVLGQGDFERNGENRWEHVGADTFCWPYGVCLHRSRLAVADSGNNRVMLWELGE